MISIINKLTHFSLRSKELKETPLSPLAHKKLPGKGQQRCPDGTRDEIYQRPPCRSRPQCRETYREGRNQPCTAPP